MTYANRLPTMYELPNDEAQMIFHLAPLSATLTTRRSAYFSNDPNPPKATNPLGNYKRKRKRATEVDVHRARKMRAEGCGIEDIAAALNVSTRSVVRAIAVKRRAYRSLG